MKKFLIALTLICTVFTVSAFASDVKVTSRVLSAFNASFNNAQNVKWAHVKDMYQAQFTIDDEQYSAYFDIDGSLVVVARFITDAQLPQALKRSLQTEAEGQVISYLFELTDSEGVHYYATLDKEGKKTMLKSAGTKRWIPYNKVKI
jgi:hypothetical protein